VNNSDFKCFLKVGREPLSLSWAGNEFHTVDAATRELLLLFIIMKHGVVIFTKQVSFSKRLQFT